MKTLLSTLTVCLRQVLKSYKLMMLSSMGILLLASFPYQGVSLASLSITGIAMTFQYLISIHKKVIRKKLPLEEMSSNHVKSRAFNHDIFPLLTDKGLVALLCLTPAIFILWQPLGVIYLISIILLKSRDAKFIFKLYTKDKEHPENQIKKLLNYSPEVAVYVTGIQDVAYQINQWLPVLEALPFKFVIIIRERKTFLTMKETSVPVYFAHSMRELEHFRTAGVKTVLYPANTQKNVQLLRLSDLNHFFINHGESDKVVNQSKFLMAYDKLLVGGPLAKRRLEAANLPLRDDQVEFVGRPQTELLLQKSSERIKDIKTILYAPTWEGFVEEADYSSVTEQGFKMLQAIVESRKYKVIFKPHPFTGAVKKTNKHFLKRMREYCLSEDSAVYAGFDTNLYELMNQSDILISDVSSVANEYLYTLKPIVMTNFKDFDALMFEQKFATSRATYLVDSTKDINRLLDDIAAADQKFTLRKEVLDDSLGCSDVSSLKRFESVISNSLT